MVVTITEQPLVRSDDGSFSEPGSGGSSREEASSSNMSTTNHSTSNSKGSSSRNTYSFARLAEKESRRVSRSKIMVLFVLMVAAVVVGVTAFFALQKEAEKEFQSEFKSVSVHFFEQVQVRSDTVIGAYSSLSQTLTGYSLGLDFEWPYVTIPDFGAQLSQVRNQIRAHSLSFCPLVTQSRRLEWEAYADANQGWVNTSLELENSDETLPSIRTSVEPVSDNPNAVYAPIWQVTPVSTHHASINFDSLVVVDSLYESLLENPVPTFSTFFYNYPEGSSMPEGYLMDEDTWPRGSLSQPVFEKPLAAGDDVSSQNVVGIVNADLSWHIFLKDQLPRSAPPGFEVVLKQSCGDVDTIAYRLDGPNVTFTGTAYTPEAGFASLVETTTLIPFPTLQGCEITLLAYPTADFQAYFQSNEPYLYLGAIIGIFFVAAVAFLIYDYAVEARQKIVMIKVARSNAIVNSLFPTQVRDRLMAGEGNDEDHFSGTQLAKKAMDRAIKDGRRTSLHLGNTKPIADLYPHSTVMFADIANFTAWSSVREPTQVFTLLEAVYGSFDKIAKQRRVFKVETIGDCYVAVAGLPEPRKDHAVVMARFARDCVVSMHDVVAKLEIFLGPDTADLEIRVGLHSGPVTAGVLRGEKSRFQLFGDTVNTTARMESTGEKSKVHVSKDTAELLIAAGKSHWVIPRKELVSAKGKGTMQTYWLEFRIQAQSKEFSQQFTMSSRRETESQDDDSLDEYVIEGLPKDNLKEDRLVSWNVEILTRLIQKIVAMRKSEPDNNLDKSDSSHIGMSRHNYNVDKLIGSTPLDEVKEIIKLTNKTSKFKCNPSEIALSAVVQSQLRDFVKTVATMYRNNPFHNFEHASHVTQSMTKFISRVVTADEIDYNEMAYKKKGAAKQIHDFTYGITSDPLIEFACTVSALIHDLDHPGVPNQILVKEGADIAAHYKNKSVAEQNSVDLAWELLMEPKYHELRNVICRNPAEMDRFRQLIVNSVMATDIADKELGQLRKKRWEKAFSAEASGVLESAADAVNRKATIVIEHLIQAADVAHTMQHWHVYQKWNERLFREMYDAYLTGRSDVDPSRGWYKGEIGFFDFYIIPLAKKLDECGVFGVSSDECLEYAKANRAEWVSKGETIVKRYLESYQVDAEKSKRGPSK